MFLKFKIYTFYCIFGFGVLVAGACYSPVAFSGVMLSGTRIILNADERNVSTVVSNITDKDYAVQVWVNGQEDNNNALSPFIAMPALFRVRAGEEQVVRIIKTPGTLPLDRESVFYFNAQEIPIASKNDENALKVAIRTRVKFFYRPEKLATKPADAPGQLQWKLVNTASGSSLRVTNPSPYHITFIGIKAMDGNNAIELSDVAMVAPKSSQEYPLEHKVGAQKVDVEFSVINDYGGYSAPSKSIASF
ncbi:fimbrial biogenesis chaperone [Pseudomonas sp. MDT2-39-1]